MWQRRAHGAHRREEVDRERAGPVGIGDGQVPSRSRSHGADVVDHDVEVLVLRDGFGDECVGSGLGAEVDQDRVQPPAFGEQVEFGTALV
jgi:hypothetical protein